MGRKTGLVWGLLLVMGLLLACGGPAQEGQQPAQEGQALVEERCSECHTLDRVTSASKTQDEWSQTVDSMITRGATLDEQERGIVIGYLAETYGP